MKRLSPVFLIAALALYSCGGDNTTQVDERLERQNNAYDLSLKDKLGPFKALSASAINADNPSSDAKIKLGHTLYFDTQLSKDGNISCNSCHNLKTFGVDNLPTSPGDKGENGDRNSPTVLNAALHSTQFWDGRAKDIEEQAGMPILNPVEMAIPNEKFLIDRLKKDQNYVALFAAAYPDQSNPLTYENLRKAIASFERKLLTPSPFDAYLNGNMSAISLEAKKGLTSFVTIGCTSCHAGELLGGTMFQKFGVYADYWTLTNSKKMDEGRKAVSGMESDQYVFKVPSLRNIAKTAPYFHDGSVDSLGLAVRIMAKAQLNYDLSKEEEANLVAFLESLTGEVPANYQSAPVK